MDSVMTHEDALRAENDLLKKQLEDANRRLTEFSERLSPGSTENSPGFEHLPITQLEVLDALLAVSPDRFFILDKNGQLIYSDKRGLETLKVGPEAMVNQHWQTFDFPTENAGFFTSQIETVLATGQAITREYSRLMAGEEWYFECTLAPYRGPEGEIAAILSTVRNITKRKLAEKALLESRDFYMNLFDEAPTMIWRSGSDGKVNFFNKTWQEFTGRTLEQESDEGWTEGIHPDDLATLSRVYKDAYKSRQPYEHEYRHRRYDGEYRWLVDRGRPFYDLAGNFAGYIGSCYDITPRKQMQEELYRSEQVFKALVENATDIIIRVNREMRYFYANPAVEKASGIAAQLFIGKTPAELDVPAENLELMQEKINLVYQTGQEQTVSYEYPHAQGVNYYHARLIPEFSQDGSVETVLGITRDITDLKEIERALEAEKERLSVTLRSIGDAVIATDTAGNITLINQEAERLTGWHQDEAAGQPISAVFQISDQASLIQLENPIVKVLQTGQIVELPNQIILKARDGRKFQIANQGSPIRDKDGQLIGAVLVFRDITEKEKMSAELFRASKLESLGIMAGGIAHDFNNILTVIMGNLSLTKLYANPGGKIHIMLEEAERASAQAKDLTQQLLTFAKGGAPVKRPILLPDILKDAATFALHGTSLQLVFNLPSNLWTVEADDGQLSRAIQNLVINAAQAMPGSGKIMVKAENLSVTAGAMPPLEAGNYLHISVQDYGAGISPEFLPRIFDPYFTTKKQGSGLGLAVVYSVVHGHNGHVRVESELGVGTTVHLYIPALAQTAPVTPPVVTPTSASRGKQRVLIMDDEALIRKLAVRVLHHLGYEVETSKDGTEAIDLYLQAKASGNPFDVVIMDLTVPGGMGGEEALKRLLAFDREVKAIVSSGYSHDPVMANYQNYGFKAVVTKPYGVEQLGSVLSQVLASSA